MDMSWSGSTILIPGLNGFGMGAGLIIAIGAQNAFVLRQGIKRRHVLPVVLTCILVDVLLIIAGSLGLGAFISSSELLTTVTRYGGAVFLVWYGIQAFRRFLSPGSLAPDTERHEEGRMAAVGTTLALSLLNPHVYLDTVVLIGSLAAQWPMPLRISFVAGAILASVVWFLVLGYGSSRLAPLFRKPSTWRILDLIIAGVMWSIAVLLIL